MQFLIIFAAILLGLLVGILVTGFGILRLEIGTLRAVSDEDGTYLFLDLKVHPGSLKNRNWALVKIDSKPASQN